MPQARNKAGILLDEPVTVLKGVGPVRAAELAKLSIETVEDLVLHFPRRYEDMRAVKRIAEVQPGEHAGIKGRIVGFREQPARQRRGLIISRAMVDDGTGQAGLLWFTHGWRLPSPMGRRLTPGSTIQAFGLVEAEGPLKIIKSPAWDVSEGGNPSLHLGRIVPVYPLTSGLTNKYLRTLVDSVFSGEKPAVGEELPPSIRQRLSLLLRDEALRLIHFPGDWSDLERGRRTLAMTELIRLQVALGLRRRQRDAENQGIPQPREGEIVDRLRQSLPFRLTGAQDRACAEVFQDMSSPRPMNRLLQGDVGTGKTAVAAMAMAKTLANGYQAAMMVPTGILAEQHHQTLSRWFAPLGFEVGLLTGDQSKKDRDKVLAGVASGEIKLVVGTHALLGAEVDFAGLGLVIADEQHRFGVVQRQRLWAKGQSPDVLIMSATPIPRTLAQILYGDLEVSVLDQRPPGRQPVVTRWINKDQRPRVYDFIKQYLSAGQQAYLVCPRIEEGDDETRGIETVAQEVAGEFQGFTVGVLHGQLAPAEKDKVMRSFRDGKTQLLIATTVIENGIDVPNATVMVIEEADRFGLAQLHQLRGRVGRGDKRSYCILLGEPRSEEGTARLQAMTESDNGLVLAEKDLKLRGSGEIFGLRQHGDTGLGLRLADPFRDVDMMEQARQEAQAILTADPELAAPEHGGLRRQVEKYYHLALDTPVSV